MKFIIFVVLVSIAVCAFRSYSYAGNQPLVGSPAPNFNLLDANSVSHQLSDYANQWLVLYFYPKNNTPGCTKEACNFRDDFSKLEKLGAKIVGISVDETSSHAEFSKKYHLPFPLLADIDGKVSASYGALHNFGIIKLAKRYTFLIDPTGKISKVYLGVDTSNHSKEVISDLQALIAAKKLEESQK